MLTLVAAVRSQPTSCPVNRGKSSPPREPKPQNTDNWHIRHLPAKCLAHAETFTQSAGGPALRSHGGDNGRQRRQPQHHGFEPPPFVHEIPQLKVPCSDCEVPGLSLALIWTPQSRTKPSPISLAERSVNQSARNAIQVLPNLCSLLRWASLPGGPGSSLFHLLFPHPYSGLREGQNPEKAQFTQRSCSHTLR